MSARSQSKAVTQPVSSYLHGKADYLIGVILCLIGDYLSDISAAAADGIC